MVNSFTTDNGKVAVQLGKPREEFGIMLTKEVFEKGDKETDAWAKVERTGSMEFLHRVFRGTEDWWTRNAVLPVQWGLSTEYWRPSPSLHELLTPGFWCKHESD